MSRLNQLNRIKAMVFEGGGALGPAHVGAVERFAGILPNVKNFAGSSSGSIMAMALACGAPLESVRNAMLSIDFNLLLDNGEGCKGMARTVTKWGWYEGSYITRWVDDFIATTPMGKKDMTFNELFQRTGNELVITTVSINMNRVVYCSKDTTPDMPIKIAVRRSVGLPLVFQPDVEDGDRYIDGGTLDNYPIRVFDYKLDHDEVIGFKLLNSPGENQDERPVIHPPRSLAEYTYRVLAMLLVKSNSVHIDDEDWQRSVKIKCGRYGSLDFDITRDDKEVLMEYGRAAADVFLTRYE